MAKPIVRLLTAFLLALGVGLLVSSSMWVATAQPQSPPPGQLFGTTTVFRVTIPKTVVTSPASTTPTSISTTPTTKGSTAVTRLRPTATTTTVAPPTTPAPTTTVAAIPGAAPPPVTLPFAVAQQSGHVSVFFPILSGIGFAALMALLVAQWVLTAPGNRGGPTL